MTLSSQHKWFLLRDHVVGSAIVNFALNVGIAWLLFRKRGPVPVWHPPEVAVDMVITLFLLPFLTCLIVTRQVSKDVREGKVPGVAGPLSAQLRWLPAHVLHRAWALGLLAVGLLAPPSLLLLDATHLSSIGLPWFALAKGLCCAALGTVVAPVVALYALVDFGPAETTAARPCAPPEAPCRGSSER